MFPKIGIIGYNPEKRTVFSIKNRDLKTKFLDNQKRR